MTVSTDLAKTYGSRRRLFLKIDGVEPILWQDDGTGVAITGTGWSRSGLVCLEAPQEEYSLGLTLGDNVVSPSQMSFRLRNIDDPSSRSASTTKYFAKLFAPGRHSGAVVTRLAEQVTTDETAIDLVDATDFAASGTVYVGQETISYTGKTGNTLTGCTRGLYPCIGTEWAQHFDLPVESGTTTYATSQQVASVPFSFFGRRAALYVTTYDETAGTWANEDDSLLLWVGRISGSIRYEGREDKWCLACQSAISDLEKTIAVDLPSRPLFGINLLGDIGRTFSVRIERFVYYTSFLVKSQEAIAIVEVPRGLYGSRDTILKYIVDYMNQASNYTFIIDATPFALPTFMYKTANSSGIAGQHHFIAFGASAGIVPGLSGVTSLEMAITINPTYYSGTGFNYTEEPCHALQALGFRIDNGPMSVRLTTEQPDGVFKFSVAGCTAYHPMLSEFNGGVLCLVDDSAAVPFWTEQGDWPDNSAAISIPVGKDEEAVLRYDGTGTQAIYEGWAQGAITLSLVDGDLSSSKTFSDLSYVADYDDAVTLGLKATQVYWPSPIDDDDQWRGPFEMLLYPLLSTGSQGGYNHATYDALPKSLSCGVDATIVDVDSFLEIDAAIRGNPLATRPWYFLKGESVAELLKRECALWGVALAWDTALGKLTLKKIIGANPLASTVTLTDSNSSDAMDFPDADETDGSVINCYEIEYTDKPGYPKARMQKVTVQDVESISALNVTKTQTIDHPGIYPGTYANIVAELLTQHFRSHFEHLRYPWQAVTRSLSPNLFPSLGIGDVVALNQTGLPDPYGTGVMTAACYALVTNVSWSLETWTGKATLLLYSQWSGSLVVPWAAAAVVDQSATNGGWDDANDRLTLLPLEFGLAGDSDDGAAFAAADVVAIVERAPADPTSPQTWTGLVVDKAYEADGTNILTLATGTTLSGWNASIEYVVIPDAYSAVVTAQKSLHAFTADAATHNLGSDRAHRWAW